MSQIDQDDYAQREANMIQTVQRLAAEHGCTVTIHFDSYCMEIDGPEENQVALAQALADNLMWCEV